MIPELDKYQGVVFRQLLVACPEGVRMRSVNLAGRMDAFSVGGAAIVIKHSSKRLSPWRFTFHAENLEELFALKGAFDPVWTMLACGGDGVVALSTPELVQLIGRDPARTSWVRVSRSRNAMYRISGSLDALYRAKPRGVEPFVVAARAAGRLLQ